ncbi:hypothetical protein NJF54_22025 [Pseudomonas guariconensis]|uniref:lipopolysaccharide biosynthesis protein n=1 Tax=Pseudomonas guariconensis TaxID=1288410 RepID=UPI00209B6A14|nr:hypothetical protein [Pseudomonas guariconensis]MCO7634499.1 hypothetical protein [Pseudomonas guariconensis]
MDMLLEKLLSNRILLRVLNIGIRGGTVLGRFVLIMFLAKFLPEADVGKFGIFVATVLFCVLLVSFDFNKYMYGELFAQGEGARARILGSHFKTVVCLYLVSIPFFYLIFFGGFIEFDYIVYFYLTLFFVMVSLELEALLVVLGNQLLSSFVFFTQTSAWVFFVVPVVYFFPAYRSLEFIYLSWLGGAGLSILIALCFLKANNIRVDFNGMGGAWVRSGLKKSVIFLLSSIMLKLLLTVDRYVMEYYSTPELVGVYVFYISVVMGVFNFLDPAVFSFIYPKLLRSYKEGNHAAYAAAHKELICSTAIGVVVLALFIGYLVPYIIEVLSLHAYEKNLDSLWLVIFAAAVFKLGFIPHYVLYSRGMFNWLSYSNAASLVAFLLSAYCLSMQSTISLLASCLLIAFSVGGAVKLYAAYGLRDGQVHNVQ